VAALVWLLIPLSAVAAAAIWGRWAARQRSTNDGVSLAGYERFRQAMQTTAPHAGDPKAAGSEAATGSRAGSQIGSNGQSETRSKTKGRVKVRSKIRAPKEPKRPGVAKGPQRPVADRADRRARAGAAGAAVEGVAPAEGEGDSPRGPVAGPVP